MVGTPPQAKNTAPRATACAARCSDAHANNDKGAKTPRNENAMLTFPKNYLYLLPKVLFLRSQITTSTIAEFDVQGICFSPSRIRIATTGPRKSGSCRRVSYLVLYAALNLKVPLLSLPPSVVPRPRFFSYYTNHFFFTFFRGNTSMGEHTPAPDAFLLLVATEEHFPYAEIICTTIEEAARARGTGIAKRTPEYIRSKMSEGKAVIALHRADDGTHSFGGFCYIETWSNKKYVANSGLIVVPEFRKSGLAKRIKRRILELSRQAYPEAKVFGITTSHAVMKINTELGYVPVPFSELTDDEEFWNGCRSCPNHDILTRTHRRLCLCTGMLYVDKTQPLPDAVQQQHLYSIALPPLEQLPAKQPLAEHGEQTIPALIQQEQHSNE